MSNPPSTQRLPFKSVEGHSVHLEVWLPSTASGPVPAYIWIHGGGFFDGAAADCSAMNLLPILERGWAFVSLEYRLAPQVKLDDIIEDVRDGCEFVQSGGLDKALGGGKVDGGRLAVSGASAGGMLALVAGYTLPTPPAVVSVIYPAADITHPSYTNPVAFPEKIAYDSVEAHLSVPGPVVSHAPANVDFSTMIALDRTRACFYVAQEGLCHPLATGSEHPLDSSNERFVPLKIAQKAERSPPPTVIIHGSADPMVPLGTSQNLLEGLKERGVDARLVVLEGESHGFDLVPGAMEDEKKVEATKVATDFVQKYLA